MRIMQYKSNRSIQVPTSSFLALWANLTLSFVPLALTQANISLSKSMSASMSMIHVSISTFFGGGPPCKKSSACKTQAALRVEPLFASTPQCERVGRPDDRSRINLLCKISFAPHRIWGSLPQMHVWTPCLAHKKNVNVSQFSDQFKDKTADRRAVVF